MSPILRGRGRMIVANAEPLLEPGESVIESVVVNEVPSGRGTNVALLLTERHLYAIELAGMGWTKVGEIRNKVPLPTPDVVLRFREISLAGKRYYPLLFGSRAMKRLAERAGARRD